MYEIYSFPNCEKCHNAIEEFDRFGIDYVEIKAGSNEGKKQIRELMKRDRELLKQGYEKIIQRDDDGMIILPLIVEQTDNNPIYQGEKGLEEILKNENC